MKEYNITWLAQEAGLQTAYPIDHPMAKFIMAIETRAAEEERERCMQLFLDPENQPTQFGTATQEYREQEIKQEREACAKLADDIDPVWESISDAIRARGQA